MIALFYCLFVYFCLSLFILNSFTLYYFHFMLPLHIQIISLKDCLILSNISIWKFLRIIEKYEKHSLTASKYSRHFRHSLAFHHYGIGLVTKPREPGDISVAFDTMEDTGFLLEASL